MKNMVSTLFGSLVETRHTKRHMEAIADRDRGLGIFTRPHNGDCVGGDKGQCCSASDALRREDRDCASTIPGSVGEPSSRFMIDQDAVMGYQFDALIHRMVDKFGWTEERARAVFEETKDFLYSAATSDEPKSPGTEVDEFWHNFILFTQEYTEFCRAKFGRYIHHHPKRRGEVYAGRCSCSGKSCSDKVCKT